MEGPRREGGDRLALTGMAFCPEVKDPLVYASIRVPQFPVLWCSIGFSALHFNKPKISAKLASLSGLNILKQMTALTCAWFQG